MITQEELQPILAHYNCNFSESQISSFAYFLSNVEQFGTVLGLTDAKGSVLVVDHLIDTLLAVPVLAGMSLKSICDVGSGAGFPGIALAIALPEIQFTLVERMQRRARFLQMLQLKLQLSNLNVSHKDLQQVDQTFDAITFRALTTLDVKLVAALRARAQRIIAYKGRLAVVEQELAWLQSAGYQAYIQALAYPQSKKERHLLIIE